MGKNHGLLLSNVCFQDKIPTHYILAQIQERTSGTKHTIQNGGDKNIEAITNPGVINMQAIYKFNKGQPYYFQGKCKLILVQQSNSNTTSKQLYHSGG